jgi:hypothetical protein
VRLNLNLSTKQSNKQKQKAFPAVTVIDRGMLCNAHPSPDVAISLETINKYTALAHWWDQEPRSPRVWGGFRGITHAYCLLWVCAQYRVLSEKAQSRGDRWAEPTLPKASLHRGWPSPLALHNLVLPPRSHKEHSVPGH